MARFVSSLLFLQQTYIPTGQLTIISTISLSLSAHGSNLASVNAAERLGFVNETPFGIRAERVVPAGKEAPHAGRAGDARFEAGIKSRDSFMLGITYWEWEETVRDKVKALVERKEVVV